LNFTSKYELRGRAVELFTLIIIMKQMNLTPLFGLPSKYLTPLDIPD